MKFRIIIAFLAGGGAAVLLAACGDDSKTPVAPTFVPFSAPVRSPVATTSVPVATTSPVTTRQVNDSRLPSYMLLDWKTDFTKHSVSCDEISPAGLRDLIPPIDHPTFLRVSEAPEYMNDEEPVFTVEVNGDARAYPLAILVKHEIVNDELGVVPVVVTFCPLCNSAIVFKRKVNGMTLDSGVSGNVRFSDLIMWDRQTESWWQQISGEAIVGELTGTILTFIPASVVSWREFREAYPDGRLLVRDLNSGVNYDSPSYVVYDSPYSYPDLLNRAPDTRLPTLMRVVGLSAGGQDVAYPFSMLSEEPVYNDSVNGTNLVVFYAGGTLSPFPGPQNTEKRVVGARPGFFWRW